ncbi:polysaccharide deacetylase family protein|uniref:Peptidoglycan/xylan/chitin deacetylase, PgdA/CDA1 family n=2 Tax=Dendrosporobacter quercicolus TaxID=146817 RepID=A0A1G9QR51_9FIRM|nr:polysaccharide deacetylase family protein [Dendrosporobacter quercicolus DSM 1736]SDM13474.1 Peptidoglycan/xylan/chitin deacetylase, PgdA/CDA1 family [Dendrosporobacter quercicolus]
MLTRRQFLKSGAGVLGAAAGLSFFSASGIIDQFSQSLPVLLYHRVGPESDDLTVSTERFAEDMAYLAREGYHTISLDQVGQQIRGAIKLPEKPVLITFDDGYLDNYTNAFPILQNFGLQASFYLITGMIGQVNRMSAAQVREMQAAGMSFGSHTVTHRPLAGLTPNEAAAELNNSKTWLEQMLGREIAFTAYPCGSFSAQTLRLAAEAGYIGGFSTRSGLAAFRNRLAIRRIPIFHFDRSIAYVMLKKGFLPTLFGQ